MTNLGLMDSVLRSIKSQNDFWAESVACANVLEDIVIKAGRSTSALKEWNEDANVGKWMKYLIQFGRIGVVNKRKKMSAKMDEKGYPAMMVGYAPNHGYGTYKMYNPKKVLSYNKVRCWTSSFDHAEVKHIS